MSWGQLLDKAHPVWKLAQTVVVVGGVAYVCAFFGADDLDAKDIVSHLVNGAAIYGVARKGGQ